jgi:hypothetical protein
LGVIRKSALPLLLLTSALQAQAPPPAGMPVKPIDEITVRAKREKSREV